MPVSRSGLIAAAMGEILGREERERFSSLRSRCATEEDDEDDGSEDEDEDKDKDKDKEVGGVAKPLVQGSDSSETSTGENDRVRMLLENETVGFCEVRY